MISIIFPGEGVTLLRHFIFISNSRQSVMLRKSCFNPLNTKINDLNFHLFEDVSPYRDPQRQVGKNYS